jgi:hypothetical protein
MLCCVAYIAEPVDVVQPTCIAALNLNYPGSRLMVQVMDDGNSSAMRDMVQQLQFQARLVHCNSSWIFRDRERS